MSTDNEALNRAVAEKIFGWRWDGNVWRTPAGETKMQWVDAPNYCGDVSLIVQVLGEMRKTHIIEIEWSSDRTRVQLAPYSSLSESQPHLKGCVLGSDVDIWQETFCVAALRARGHETSEL